MNEPMFSLHHSGEGATRRNFAIPGRQTPRSYISDARQPAREIAPLERPATA